MVKFKVQGKDGRDLVGLGMTPMNIAQMKQDRPIYIMGAEMGLPFDIMLFYGASEKAIFEMFKREGLIHPEHTVIHDTSDKPKPRN